MIKIYLLIGFLGAGKTTLLQSLLESYKDRKIGVVVNEFGEVNVDAQLVKREGIEMAELSNGSVFCACIKDRFVDSLIELSALNLEILFIEASGLADPSNMGQILDGIRHKTADIYEMTGMICVVDALNFIDLMDLLPALARQVEYANAVIINKADLVDNTRIEDVSSRIHEINPSSGIYITSYCRVDIGQVTSHFADTKKVSEETTNTYVSRPNAFILRAETPISYVGLENFLKQISPSSFRIKGFAETDQGNIEISAVMTDIHLSKWQKEIQGTEIVVISAVGIKLLSSIISASNDHLGGRLKI